MRFAVVDMPAALDDRSEFELSAHDRLGLRLRLSTSMRDIPYARAAVTRLCEHLGFDKALTERIRLAVTEACTNCALHAYHRADTATYVLDARVERGTLRVDVRDRGVGFVDLAPSRNVCGMASGLTLMRAMADSVDVSSRLERGTRVVLHFETQSEVCDEPADPE
jgi:anti-sigma regulatory factor (Ser/Thr protein kinase)